MQAMPQAQLIPACPTFSSLLPVLTHNTKNDYTTFLIHYTKHHITHLLYTPNTLYVTNLSTLKTCHLCHCLYHRQRPSHNFPSSSATKLAACGHFCDKSPFLLFLPAPDTKQTWRRNVREKAWRTLFTLSPVLDLPVRPSSREVGCGGEQLATQMSA